MVGGGGGFGDGAGHFLLLGAVVVGQLMLLAVGFEGAAGFEEAVSGLDGKGCGIGVGGDHEVGKSWVEVKWAARVWMTPGTVAWWAMRSGWRPACLRAVAVGWPMTMMVF